MVPIPLPRKRHRLVALTVVLLACLGMVALQGVTASPDPHRSPPLVEGSANASVLAPNNTLVSVQAYGWFGNTNGSVRIVTPAGRTVWEYDPPNAAVFDAELLTHTTPRTRANDTRVNDTAVNASSVLVSMGVDIPASRCPERFQGRGGCIRNRVVEVALDTKAVVWEHAWYDAFVRYHEVHDADRLASGETLIADMGNNRAFTVARNGSVTWQWNANESLGNGSGFRERYGGPDRGAPESDWTHLNDVDRLDNGNVQVSVRNFDTVLEIDPDTNEIVSMVGQPGNHTVIQRQHDPQRLETRGTVLVADSENNRVVEVDPETGEIVWGYDGNELRRPLQWPRDADRLPNGNTVIADSRNFRVLEVNATGAVVWRYSLREERGIVYDADRIGVPEAYGYGSNATNASVGPDPSDSSLDDGTVMELLYTAESWAGFFLPRWIRWPELLTLCVGGLAVLLLSIEGLASLVGRVRASAE